MLVDVFFVWMKKLSDKSERRFLPLFTARYCDVTGRCCWGDTVKTLQGDGVQDGVGLLSRWCSCCEILWGRRGAGGRARGLDFYQATTPPPARGGGEGGGGWVFPRQTLSYVWVLCRNFVALTLVFFYVSFWKRLFAVSQRWLFMFGFASRKCVAFKPHRGLVC